MARPFEIQVHASLYLQGTQVEVQALCTRVLYATLSSRVSDAGGPSDLPDFRPAVPMPPQVAMPISCFSHASACEHLLDFYVIIPEPALPPNGSGMSGTAQALLPVNLHPGPWCSHKLRQTADCQTRPRSLRLVDPSASGPWGADPACLLSRPFLWSLQRGSSALNAGTKYVHEHMFSLSYKTELCSVYRIRSALQNRH